MGELRMPICDELADVNLGFRVVFLAASGAFIFYATFTGPLNWAVGDPIYLL
jgi:hypothetical protein